MFALSWLVQFACVLTCTSMSGHARLIARIAPRSDTIIASAPASFRRFAYSAMSGISSGNVNAFAATYTRTFRACAYSHASRTPSSVKPVFPARS